MPPFDIEIDRLGQALHAWSEREAGERADPDSLREAFLALDPPLFLEESLIEDLFAELQETQSSELWQHVAQSHEAAGDAVRKWLEERRAPETQTPEPHEEDEPHQEHLQPHQEDLQHHDGKQLKNPDTTSAYVLTDSQWAQQTSAPHEGSFSPPATEGSAPAEESVEKFAGLLLDLVDDVRQKMPELVDVPDDPLIEYVSDRTEEYFQRPTP